MLALRTPGSPEHAPPNKACDDMLDSMQLFVSLPLLPAQAATDGAVDSTGLAIGLAVLVAAAIAAYAMLKSKSGRVAPTDDTQKAAPAAVVDVPSDEARQAAKALRRAARGGVKVGADGELKRLDSFDLDQQTRRELEDSATRRSQVRAPQADDGEQRAYLEAGLSKTRSEGFVARLGKLFQGKQIDAALLTEIEEVLYRADLGVKTADRLLDALKVASSRKELEDTEHVWKTLRQKSLEILRSVGERPLQVENDSGPAVLMVVGVNGSGKTTTIGKLAHRYAAEGRKVIVAAADTFRAAAVDQLEVWCQRAGVELFRGKENADPASVVFAAIEKAKADGADLVIIDTAGRLHTNSNLMEELRKVGRVAAKAQAGAPHEVLLVLDATMGQNAVKQAELFREAIDVTGIALTKLDGTAKGGVVLAIAEALKLRVKLVGVGERMQDLRDFDADLFVETLFDGKDGHAAGPVS